MIKVDPLTYKLAWAVLWTLGVEASALAVFGANEHLFFSAILAFFYWGIAAVAHMVEDSLA